MSHLKFLFDRFPDHNGCRFIEVEDEQGKSLRAGEWRERQDGLVEFVVPVDGDVVMLEERLRASEARCAELRECLSCMQSHYVTTLEAGHDRITFLGGDCDSVQRMLSDNPDYAKSVKLLAQSVPARHTIGNCPDCGHDNVLCACGYKL